MSSQTSSSRHTQLVPKDDFTSLLNFLVYSAREVLLSGHAHFHLMFLKSVQGCRFKIVTNIFLTPWISLTALGISARFIARPIPMIATPTHLQANQHHHFLWHQHTLAHTWNLLCLDSPTLATIIESSFRCWRSIHGRKFEILTKPLPWTLQWFP